jgi:hypothetical protein
MSGFPWKARAGLAVLFLAGLAVAATADSYSPRQYYGGYQKHPKYAYSYRTYYYKPTPDYVGYKHQYAVYNPSQPQYVYFYNPYKKQYWGRCPSAGGGRAAYQILDEKDRKANLEEIDESAFSKPGKMPPVPESEDGATMDAPPDDLPGTDKLPVTK